MFLGVEEKNIIESELILVKVFWSATNWLREDASKNYWLQYTLSVQIRKYLVFN